MRLGLLLLVAALGLLGGAVFYGTQPVEYARQETADGRFVVVATSARFRTWIPMAPGSGGDKPGTITVYTRDGRSCGGVPVDFVSQLYEVQEDPARPHTLWLPLVAEWDVQACSVERAAT